MKKACIICLSIIFTMCLNLKVYSEEIPNMMKCTFIVLRTSEGWWLRINNDESGSYGFGTQPEKVEVKNGTFNFKQVYSETRKVSAEVRKKAEGPYVTVSYYVFGNSSARE